MNNKNKKHYGWRPDLPDHRDLKFAAKPSILKKLPPKIDLTKECPEIYNQGNLGSCTANAIGAAFQFNLIKQKAISFIPSRLFIYYNERAMEGTLDYDSGAAIRDGVKSINKLGVCPETLWHYSDSPTDYRRRPTPQCYKAALTHQALAYHRINRTLDQLKGCLAEGYPVIFGFTVYDAFESPAVARTGTLNMPKPTERVLGGHAVLAIGYDDSTKRFRVRNSWGGEWGKKGYFTMPYEYLMDGNLSDDFWTVRVVEG